MPSSRARITAPQIALEAAAKVAREAGLTPHILGDSLEGESRDVAKTLAGIARQFAVLAAFAAVLLALATWRLRRALVG